MSDPSGRALEVFSGHLRRLEDGGESDLDALCGEHSELADDLLAPPASVPTRTDGE